MTLLLYAYFTRSLSVTVTDWTSKPFHFAWEKWNIYWISLTYLQKQSINTRSTFSSQQKAGMKHAEDHRFLDKCQMVHT